jgi:hypothetical protein
MSEANMTLHGFAGCIGRSSVRNLSKRAFVLTHVSAVLLRARKSNVCWFSCGEAHGSCPSSFQPPAASLGRPDAGGLGHDAGRRGRRQLGGDKRDRRVAQRGPVDKKSIIEGLPEAVIPNKLGFRPKPKVRGESRPGQSTQAHSDPRFPLVARSLANPTLRASRPLAI